jgi:ribonuclease HI
MFEQQLHFTIHADGGSRGNPGPAGAGALVRDEFGNAIVNVSQFLGIRTNNFAEYEAVILAFEALLDIVPEKKREATVVSVKLDSELVVKQIEAAAGTPCTRCRFVRDRRFHACPARTKQRR